MVSLSGGKTIFRAAVLSKTGDRLDVEKVSPVFHTLEKLSEYIPKGLPLIAILNTPKVIHRKVDVELTEPKKILDAVFPDAHLKDFVVQSKILKKGSIVSVTRKEVVEEFISELDEAGFWVLGVSLGVFSMLEVWPFIDQDFVDSATIAGFKFHFSPEGELQSFQKVKGSFSEENWNFGNKKVSSDTLPILGALFQYLTRDAIFSNSEKTKEIKLEFGKKRIFDSTWKAMVAGFLLLLVGAFFFTQELQEENKLLQKRIANKKQDLEQLSILEKRWDEVKEGGLLKSSKASFYADRIAVSLPGKLELDELHIFPLIGKERDYRNGEMPLYDNFSIEIKGRVKNGIIYQTWIADLEEKEWVESIEQLQFKDEGGRDNFNCIVKVKS